MMFAHYKLMHKHTRTHSRVLVGCSAAEVDNICTTLTTLTTLSHIMSHNKQRTLVKFLIFDYFSLFALHISPFS